MSALDGLIDHFQLVALRGLTILSGLFLALASVWGSVEAGLLEPRWQNVTLCSVGALFIGGAGIWVRRSIEKERKRGARCSFCGQPSGGGPLQQGSRYAGVTICPRCAATIARRYAELGDAPDELAASIGADRTTPTLRRRAVEALTGGEKPAIRNGKSPQPGGGTVHEAAFERKHSRPAPREADYE